jgi:hypothetical protein
MSSIDKVSLEVAEQEFERILDAFDISMDTSDDDEASTLNSIRKSFIRNIQRGHITIGENGDVTYIPHRTDAKPITFQELTGGALRAGERYKDNQHIAKMYAIASEMTGQNPNYFALLKGADIKMVQKIIALFLMG